MSGIKPAKIGVMLDYLADDTNIDPTIQQTLELVAEEFQDAGLLERPIEFVIRGTPGLPKGSYRAVEDTFLELVKEDCLVIFGPCVSENAVPLRDIVESTAKVACISMGGTESLLGEWMFGLPNGSMEEEPIIMAKVATYDGCKTVGIVFEDSLLGNEYLRSAREACKEVGLKITGEAGVPQVEADKNAVVRALAEGKPDCIMHVGYGYGLPGINAALKEIGWMPRRYTTTAFEFCARSQWWRDELVGWVGLDQYDERNPVGEAFLDRFEAKYGSRPSYFFSVYCYDIGRMMVKAVASARPLTGKGVKEALERIKMMPAASGAPGTRLRFGKYIRHGWMGSEFLVARRVLDDASGTVIHATIEGLVEPVS
jgi:ABC-type branched-subunit amino acid transport system substrate-binding protein